jgi:hypothetical protein
VVLSGDLDGEQWYRQSTCSTRATVSESSEAPRSIRRLGSMARAPREFRIDVPDAQLEDLRARLRNARWPEREPVGDRSQGVPLAYLDDLCRYWPTSTTGGSPRRG